MAQERSAGLALSRAYSADLIEPLMAARFPGLPYSAGRLGTGSDVLGLDDETSRDHDWGLRLTLIVPEAGVEDVRRVLAAEVPDTFHGLPTRFVPSGGTAARLHVEVDPLAGFLVPRLGFDPRSGIAAADWLSLTGQSVLEVTAGPVFADADGALGRARAALAWYPDDVWRHVLACDWRRLAQELPLMGRAADVGDDRGSRLIAARLAQVIAHLAFLLERRWPPYAKWFGTVFRTLQCAAALGPELDRLVEGPDRQRRQHAAAAALQVLLDVQDDLGLTAVRRATVPFWDRPHLHPDPAIVEQLAAAVRDPAVRALPPWRGAIEQLTDDVDVLTDPQRRRAMVRI